VAKHPQRLKSNPPLSSIMQKTDHHPVIAEALKRIPPLWPLRNFVAVNPFVGLSDQPYAKACAILERVSGKSPLQAPEEYLKAWREGTITPQDIKETGGSGEAMLAFLTSGKNHRPTAVIPTVANFLDRGLSHDRWSAFVTDQISKWCGVTYDDNQTTWRSPWHGGDLFTGWKAAASCDLNPEAFGLRGFRASVAALPDEPYESIAKCLEILCPAGLEAVEFLHRQLTTVSGWAGHVQYRVHEDALRGMENHSLAGLLAIRLSYDAALFEAFLSGKPAADRWFLESSPVVDEEGISMLALWQSAYEAGYRRELARGLLGGGVSQGGKRPSFQAVFCIDVRSEVLRRHLEAAAPDARTIGFAGFFGFSVAHQTTSDEPASSRCPVLLVPGITTGEACGGRTRAAAGSWKAFQNSATSCFSFVESMGLAFGATLAKRIAGHSSAERPAPVATDQFGADLDQRVATAEGALLNMGLTKNFGRLVLICGHGSSSANNPHASSLDCGACGGHAGDVNARLAAATLNDPLVRAALADRGIRIPADTAFVAGLHLTSTDEVAIFDRNLIPVSHASDLDKLTNALGIAGEAARSERAPALGESAVARGGLLKSLRNRAGDISQVRPEWGLANNAALVAAPRERSAALNLAGRVFLHDYDATADPDDKILTLILCAPVVVASWINLQYHASRLDPANLGSGNKTLHNVAGGIGVLEGNGGDLRNGLPMQSIHDGERFIHEPRRLTVFIEAPRERLAAVLASQPSVRELFDNQWIHLCAIDGEACHLYQNNGWKRIASKEDPARSLVLS